MKKFSLLYIFVFFDGLSVASSSLFGFFFPKLFSDIFGANFGGNDLVWLKFVLLPGVAINVLLMFFALTKNCLLYTSPSPRDAHESRMPSSA